MSHSLNRIWIHAIWITKDRSELITNDIEQVVYKFIAKQLQECYVKIINGMPEHIHSLFLLNPKKSISSVIKQIKGSSSRYINQNNLIEDHFYWQTGYATFSVSDLEVEKVYHYIKNQKQHHKKISFQQEYDVFLK